MPSDDITPKTWLITGASRGMGVDFARAALAAGHQVVATGRDPDTVRSGVGEHENLLVVPLDITDAPDLEPPDRARQGLRPRAAARSGRRRLQGHGSARGDQGPAAPVTPTNATKQQPIGDTP